MALHKALMVGAKSPIVPVAPSTTLTDHSTNGTDVTITAVAHGLIVGELVTLVGWKWATGAGVVDGTYYVKTVASNDTFAVTPTVCPTSASNPETVGTYALGAQKPHGCRLAVVASSGVLIALSTGFWTVYNTGKSTDGSANAQQVAYRFGDTYADVTLPDTGFTVTTLAKQAALNIAPGESEDIEVRGGPGHLILEAASGTVVVFIKPKMRGLVG